MNHLAKKRKRCIDLAVAAAMGSRSAGPGTASRARGGKGGHSFTGGMGLSWSGNSRRVSPMPAYRLEGAEAAR